MELLISEIVSEYTTALALKSLFERVLGKKEWKKLKDHRSIGPWRKAITKILRASKLAIEVNVQVADDDWLKEARAIIDRALEKIKTETSVVEMLSVLSSTSIELSFHQIGFCPTRHPTKNARPVAADWTISRFRSVNYVQNHEQKTAAANRHK